MPYHEDHFPAADGLPLFQRCWSPDAQPAAVVAVVHGINEHSGRYEWLATNLCRQGYAVSAMDLRGHGKSEGPRAYVRSFDQYLDDLDVFLRRTRSQFPGKPIFLLGHSMGGAIAALFAITRQPDLRGLVLSGPAVVVSHRVFPLLRRLAKAFGLVFPRLRLVRLGCRFMSRDPQVIQRFLGDPLVFHGRIPCRTGAEVLRAAERIQGQMEAVRLPLLILHGSADFVADPDGSRRLHDRAESADKTIRLYEGLYHEVFSEPEREQVLGDLVAWLRARQAHLRGPVAP